jgi:hypothetical protein
MGKYLNLFAKAVDLALVRLLCSIYVQIALAFGEDRAIDCSGDSKGKL